ncbi:MAG: hypothetical protein RLZZ245_1977 [Verrucomicrobiota bacterium]
MKDCILARTLTIHVLGMIAWAAMGIEGDVAAAEPSQATITIDAQAPARTYDRMIFGGFLEHFDNQIYGGIYEPGSPLADRHGFRTDVIAALKELKVSVIRWPGGCFVDGYHWQKGVGKNRESYGEFRWGVIEPNAFGTDEFIELCRRVGAEPYICFNGEAPLQENLDWVSYCNATEGKFAEMRKANGHNQPYAVKIWSVGNERYDKDYIRQVRDTAKALKAVSPDILITCPGSQSGKEIDRYLLEQAGEYLDYVSAHEYWLDRGDQLPRYDYLTAIGKSEMPDRYLTALSKSLGDSGRSRIKVAFDEWNLRAWQHPGFPRNQVGDHSAPGLRELVERRRKHNDQADQYTMADAIFTASFLNACLRHPQLVTMANIAPLVNTRGPLFVHPDGIVKRTHFHALAMYANLLQERVAPVHVMSGSLKGTAVSTIDAVATVDESGENWSVSLINRHPSDSVSCTLKMNEMSLDGTYKATLLTGDSADSFNDLKSPARVAPRKVDLTLVKGGLDLPPHSLLIVSVPSK